MYGIIWNISLHNWAVFIWGFDVDQYSSLIEAGWEIRQHNGRGKSISSTAGCSSWPRREHLRRSSRAKPLKSGNNSKFLGFWSYKYVFSCFQIYSLEWNFVLYLTIPCSIHFRIIIHITALYTAMLNGLSATWNRVWLLEIVPLKTRLYYTVLIF